MRNGFELKLKRISLKKSAIILGKQLIFKENVVKCRVEKNMERSSLARCRHSFFFFFFKYFLLFLVEKLCVFYPLEKEREEERDPPSQRLSLL